MVYLNQDLARISIGSAAWITNLTTPTRGQARYQSQIIGQYEVAPVILLTLILLLHTAIALFIFVATALFARSDRLQLPDGESVFTLELVQMRLTESDRAYLTRSTTALNLFGEGQNDAHLRFGLRQDAFRVRRGD